MDPADPEGHPTRGHISCGHAGPGIANTIDLPALQLHRSLGILADLSVQEDPGTLQAKQCQRDIRTPTDSYLKAP